MSDGEKKIENEASKLAEALWSAAYRQGELEHRASASNKTLAKNYAEVASAKTAIVSEIEILRARVAELESREEETRRYADRLAVNIKLKHFSDRAPDWQPLPDTLGILTQRDNMTAGIGERVAELEKTLDEANEAADVRE